MITPKRILILLIVIFLLGTYRFVRTVMYDHQYQKESSHIVTIEKGMSSSVIGDLLKEQGVIQSTTLFKVALRVLDAQTSLKAGMYELNARDSYQRIISTLGEGISYNEKKLTFIEGWNLRDYAQYLIKQGIITKEDELYQEAGYPASQSNTPALLEHKNDSSLKDIPKGYSLEGYLYPDTYRFYSDVSVGEIITELVNNYHIRFEELQKRDLPQNLSWYEVMTLASVVVKEGRTFEEKKNVAGVFLNRLEIGMGLQSDPTVNYVTLKVTDNPTLEDIAVESEYNTYKYAGLPPTPIANPAYEDVLAVLEATKHEYYYFLNTKEGKLIFSKTFAEHKENRIKYGQ